MGAFKHKQPVALGKLTIGVLKDGSRCLMDDWSEVGTIRATKRDLRPMGYWVVRFPHGGELCIHENNLRAA